MRRYWLRNFLLLMVPTIFLFAIAVLLPEEISALGRLYRAAPEIYIFVSAIITIAFGFLIGVLFYKVFFCSHHHTAGYYNYDDIQSMADELRHRRSLDRDRTSALEKREGDLRLIMENMSEGLVIMDASGVIISMNRGAETLLLTDGQLYVGKHLFAVCRNSALQAAVHMAIGGTTDEAHFQLQGKHIHAIANPVSKDISSGGVVLFLLDVSREYAAEQLRREFSANVSHELKTPLTSISGYAEIMKNGMVAAQDVPRFAGNIYHEAQRMIALINDIIHLSRLDEDTEVGELTPVDLLALSKSVASRLQQKADTHQIQLYVTGSSAVVRGDAGLLEEMLFNLCDNAITYNRPGGWAEISVSLEQGGAVVRVQDNGIGIPAEHQGRVFERFYRVDKSHSRATGGTGLGLSIVKHGAQFHRAEVHLSSTPDLGTSIYLRFPAENP